MKLCVKKSLDLFTAESEIPMLRRALAERSRPRRRSQELLKSVLYRLGVVEVSTGLIDPHLCSFQIADHTLRIVMRD